MLKYGMMSKYCRRGTRFVVEKLENSVSDNVCKVTSVCERPCCSSRMVESVNHKEQDITRSEEQELFGQKGLER